MEQDFLNFVADVMGVDASTISMDKEYKTEPWDSLMMMNLIMEIEAEYDVSIPIEKIGDIKTLKDLYKFTQK